MGISSLLLFKRGDSAPANDLLRDLKKICIEENLFFDSDEKLTIVKGH